MEAAYHQQMTYLAAKSAEETINIALRWVSEAQASDLSHTVAMLRLAINHLERTIEWGESKSRLVSNAKQQRIWSQIRTIVQSIQERLAHHQQDACGTVLSGVAADPLLAR
jgi:hypothetical protein